MNNIGKYTRIEYYDRYSSNWVMSEYILEESKRDLQVMVFSYVIKPKIKIYKRVDIPYIDDSLTFKVYNNAFNDNTISMLKLLYM